MSKKPPNTVRQRKKGSKLNTQRYLPFSEIRNDTVLLKNGGLRAVLQIEPLNFNLKSETEQQGIISGYESFINTLVFPLQIVVHSSRVNIDPYIQHIREQTKEQQTEKMKQQTASYVQFVQKLVELADIMQKKFYVIIPLDDAPRKTSPLARFFAWMNVDDTLSRALSRHRKFGSQTARLKERVDLVETGLRNIGLVPKRLRTVELIELYYKFYNRSLSQSQKLPKNGDFSTEANVL